MSVGTAGNPEHLFFLGIGGTLMGSLALLAREMGCRVRGFDRALYPPMSDQLAAAGIEAFEGFEPAQLEPTPDLVVIGNAALPRGHEAVETVLERALPYVSGAEWLGSRVLPGRWTIAASGTHGKTTTASMIAHVLDAAGLVPGFMIGGVPRNFGVSARLGSGRHFVVEADEYDTSYFDRRSKFVHYRPKTLVVNNLEHDHADVFDDLAQIQLQFHHLVRTVPRNGLIVVPAAERSVDEVLAMGCWTPLARFGAEAGTGDRWQARNAAADGSRFSVWHNGVCRGEVAWQLIGEHNVANALAALAACHHAGVDAELAVEALAGFESAKRRMELIVDLPRLKIYDDFAHHPTAIRTTLAGLRAREGNARIVAVVEPRTHTMSLGTLRDALATCCQDADQAIWFQGDNVTWDLASVARQSPVPTAIEDDVDRLVTTILALPDAAGGRGAPVHVVLMSNGAFGGVYQRLRQAAAAWKV